MDRGLASFAAELKSALLEGEAGWDPAGVGEVVAGTTSMLERRGISPTPEQISDVCEAARTGFFDGSVIRPYHHPITKRLLVLGTVRVVERYFALGPPDPEKREAAIGQAENLVAQWRADLVRLFPERGDLIEETATDLLDGWRAGMRRPLSNYFMNPADARGLDLVQDTWEEQVSQLRIAPESGITYVRKAFRSAFQQALFSLQHATEGPRLPESPEIAEAARRRDENPDAINDYETTGRLAFVQNQMQRWHAEQDALVEAGLVGGGVPGDEGHTEHLAPDAGPGAPGARLLRPRDVRRIEPAFAPLEQALIDGEFDAVLAATEAESAKEEDGDFELLRLRARAAAESYWRFFEDTDMNGRTPTIEEDDALYRLSEQCTEAFEVAFRATESTYERACLTAAWWPLRLNSRFEAESVLMRSATPSAIREAGLADAERVARQTQALADVCRGVLDLTPRAAELSAADKDGLVRVLRAQYEELGAIGVPDAVFSELLRDLPAFVGFWCPLDVADRPQEEDDLRWHLWIAMTRPQPDPAERAAIDRQAEAYAVTLASIFDGVFAGPAFERTGQAHAARFLDSYRRLRENRFAPYFKQVRFAHEQRKCREFLDGVINDMMETVARETKRAEAEAATEEDLQARMQRVQRVCGPGLYHFAFYSFVRPSDPVPRMPLPERRVRSSGARLNEHGVIVFSVAKTEPFPTLAEAVVP